MCVVKSLLMCKKSVEALLYNWSIRNVESKSEGTELKGNLHPWRL